MSTTHLLHADDRIVIDLRETDEGQRARIGESELDLRTLAPGVVALHRDGRHTVAWVALSEGFVHVHWQGRVWRLEVDDQTGGRRKKKTVDEGELVAPMPGKVIAVEVAPGDDVKKGATLVLLEAMKMEHAIRAPRDGRIQKVPVGVGEMVTAGQSLVELEP